MIDLTVQDLQAFQTDQVRQGKAPASINRYVGLLSQMFALAIQWGQMSHNPVEAVASLRVRNARTRFLSDEEEDRRWCLLGETRQKSCVKIGVGGPVGSGKTALLDTLCKRLRDRYHIAVITNDIYTREDAEFLTRSGALSPDRIMGVETGGCPHTAIREDASINIDAVERMLDRFPDLELLFVESGGDNLAASFSPELVDVSIYVIDVSGGDKIPRKGGPGVTRSDLLVINKIDLAPAIGADLAVMRRDAKKMRHDRPFVCTNLKSGEGVPDVIAWIEREVLFVS